MPRQADHEQRRRHIAEAVWRLAAAHGLENVTIRQVAVEAGVPARQLQYYFGTRDDLLLGSLALLNADAQRQAEQRIAALGEDAGLRDVVRAILLELLPLDEERRRRHLVHAAYFVRFLTDPALGAMVRDAPPALENLVAELLTQATGLDRPAADREATILIALAEGLQAEVLLGQQPPERAIALVDHQLTRVFGS